MRELSRRQRARLSALEHALDHEAELAPVVVQDYRQAADDRAEPRQRPVERPAGPTPPDPTGFGEGCVI